MSKIKPVNKYALYSMGKKGQKVTQEIDRILDTTVSDIKKSLIAARDLIEELDAENLGVGDTATDEEIALALKDQIEDKLDNYSLSQYFYYLLHFPAKLEK